MIKKEGDNLVMTIPLLQKSYDAIGDEIGDVPNLIGNIIERKDGISEYTINYLIDLGYKSSQQLGCPIICLDRREELEETCRELGIDIDETPMCSICDKPLYSSFYWGDNGAICYECKHKEDKSIDKYYEEINKDIV